jgi:hypothetical protein
MSSNFNIDPHDVYKKEYDRFLYHLKTAYLRDKTEQVQWEATENLNELLDKMWEAQKSELFLLCLNTQLDDSKISLTDAMERIFKGKHSQITMQRPRKANPKPQSARKWLGE